MKLTSRGKMAMGLGQFGMSMVYMLTSTYVLYYYQDLLGVDAIAMGMILLAARVFDAFNDPVMGMIAARTRSRWGRFRPWMLGGALLCTAALTGLFSAPQAAGSLAVWAAVFYLLWGVAYTMVDIPYWSMIPYLTRGGTERERLTALVRTCGGVGGAVVSVLTMMIVPRLGGGSEVLGFSRFALITALIFLAGITVLCLCVREPSSARQTSPSLRDMFRAIVGNDQAITVIVGILLINFATQTTLNLMVYYFKYDFAGDGWNNAYVAFGAYGGVMQVLSMMVFYPLIRRRMETVRVFRLSCLVAVAGYLAFYAMISDGVKSICLLMIPAFFIFTAAGFFSVQTTVFLANAVDWGESRTGRRDESVIFSMQTFSVKMSAGISAFASSLCLSAGKLGGEANVTAASLPRLRLTLCGLPILCLLAVYFLFRFRYRLTDRRMEEIGREIDSNRN